MLRQIDVHIITMISYNKIRKVKYITLQQQVVFPNQIRRN